MEERMKKLSDELEKIQAVLASLSLSVYPEKLCIETLSVNEINFNLRSLDINELSGVLNIGITNGVSFSGVREKKKRYDRRKESITGNIKSGPECHIVFNRR